MNATRSQASKAAKYRELTTELTELWTGLAADDYRRSAEQLEEYTQQSGEQLRSVGGRSDAQQPDLDQQLSDIDITVSQLDDAVRKMERRRSSEGREEIARHESTIRHPTTQQIESPRRRSNGYVTSDTCCDRKSRRLQTNLRSTPPKLRDFAEQQQGLLKTASSESSKCGRVF
ncbi:MAG: hypothetical protein R3B91_13630 [Planctomycetaceae bacterium]